MKKLNKQAKILILAAILIVVWLFASRTVQNLNPVTWLALSPFFLTFGAKIVSCCQGSEGKMSREYKNGFRMNRRFYRIFCGQFMLIAAYIAFQNTTMLYDTILPPWLQRCLEIVFLVFFGLCSVGWLVTEIVRKDFPWGLFRLIERFFYLGVLVATAYMGTDFVVQLVMEYGSFFHGIAMIALTVIAFFTLIQLFVLLVNAFFELYLWISVPDKEEREAFKQKCETEEFLRRWKELQIQMRWDNAQKTNFWGQQYVAQNEHGSYFKIAKTGEGTYMDQDGKEYREIE